MDKDDEREQWLGLLSEAADALSALSCPWFQGSGSCTSGCQTEPSCQTDAPSGGWELQLLDAAEEIATRAGER